MNDENAPPSLNTGSRTYRLISSLGSGGFGAVFRGELRGPSGLHKSVAIKVLKPEAGDVEDFARRLRDEARLLGLLRHRAIVHVEDLVLWSGRWAVVMEYISGADLKDLILRGPLPARCVFEMAGEVVARLEARSPA